MVGVFEELDWTGFAVSKMRQRYGVLGTGLIVGFMFAAWDFLVVFWMSDVNSTAGTLPMAIFMPAVLFTWLPTYRVLMVWVYDRTESLLLAILMHVSLTASTLIFMPLATSGVTAVTYDLVLAAALWVIVGAVAVAQGGHLTPLPPRRRVARERDSSHSRDERRYAKRPHIAPIRPAKLVLGRGCATFRELRKAEVQVDKHRHPKIHLLKE